MSGEAIMDGSDTGRLTYVRIIVGDRPAKSRRALRARNEIKALLRFLMLDEEQELALPGVHWNMDESPRLIEVYCDASHAPMRSTRRKGISGAYFFALHSLIKGFSRRQTCASLSSCESELLWMQEALQEAMGYYLL